MKQILSFAVVGLTAATMFGQTLPDKALAPDADQEQGRRTISVTVTIVEAPPAKLPSDEPTERLLQRIQKLEADGELNYLRRVRLSVVEGQSNFVQRGGERTGTIVGCTARVDGETVIAKLNVEHSRFTTPRAKTEKDADDKPPPATLRTLDLETNVKIGSGATVVLSGRRLNTSDGKSQQSLVLATVKILE